MAYLFQVTIDSTAPHPLADWWAEALGWQREPSDEAFIRQMVDAGYATKADTMRHGGELVWVEGAAIRHPTGGAPRVLFQLVPEPKTVKNRVHLDVRVGPERVDAEVSRLVKRYEGSVGGIPESGPGETTYLVAQAVAGAMPGLASPSIDVGSRSLTYNLRRVSRLKAPRAGAVLRAFAAYVSREGFDHDLTRRYV